jgi:LytS/YehU family sensor histidine kinase
MLLQTLVENAIKHGVEEAPTGGDLSIRAAVDGTQLRIDVENTGSLNQPRPDSMQIGLSNARERLRLLYGERASLNLAPAGRNRVAATLTIPAA